MKISKCYFETLLICRFFEVFFKHFPVRIFAYTINLLKMAVVIKLRVQDIGTRAHVKISSETR